MKVKKPVVWVRERPLTERQERALLRVHRGVTDAIDLRLARQLAKRKLVMEHHVYERTEWNKVVARLRVVSLTAAGRAVAEALDAAVRGTA